MNLKPLDIVILLKIISFGIRKWTYELLGYELFISTADAHAGVKRASVARLFDRSNRKPLQGALEEFIIHGVKYAFPAVRGPVGRGLLTSYAAPPLNSLITIGDDLPPVWPNAEGTDKGYELNPLYKWASKACQNDPKLYELLALVDAIRDGSVRERQIAIDEIRKRLR